MAIDRKKLEISLPSRKSGQQSPRDRQRDQEFTAFCKRVERTYDELERLNNGSGKPRYLVERIDRGGLSYPKLRIIEKS